MLNYKRVMQMPRQARIKSKSGIYHVMLRGINQQQIFEEKEDYEKYIQILKDCKAISEFTLYAYCLMGNHIHLLIKPEKEPLEQIFKRISVRFIYWYNIKYQRTGHLFQDRFKSEPVEDDVYFSTVLRYIHQNPVKAGICKKPEDYKYSSYREYIEVADVVDTEFAFEIMDREEFIRFSQEANADKCMDIDSRAVIRVTDEQAQRIIYKISKCKNVTDFQNLSNEEKSKYIKKIHSKGVSIRQLSRLTGISKSLIEKCIK